MAVHHRACCTVPVAVGSLCRMDLPTRSTSTSRTRIRPATRLLFVVGAWLIACGLPGQARAEVLRVVVGGIDKQIYLPAVLAQRLGYFIEQGLEVELLNDS